jgi:DNA anti-recombination protein RmuC
MTTEERFERIEHFTAGLAEQWKKEREEDRQLWRDTQRQLNELALKISEVDERLGKRLDQLAEESAIRDRESQERDRRLGERINEVDEHLGKRIESLVPPWASSLPSSRNRSQFLLTREKIR